VGLRGGSWEFGTWRGCCQGLWLGLGTERRDRRSPHGPEPGQTKQVTLKEKPCPVIWVA